METREKEGKAETYPERNSDLREQERDSATERAVRRDRGGRTTDVGVDEVGECARVHPAVACGVWRESRVSTRTPYTNGWRDKK